MKFCPARRTLTIFTEPRLSGEDHGMKVLPIQPWGATPAPPVVPKKPPISRKPEGPWPRARVTPMPPPSCKGVVNPGYQTSSPHFSPPAVHMPPPPTRREAPGWEPEETEEKRRKMEEEARKEVEEGKMKMRQEEEEDRKRKRVEWEGERSEVAGLNNGAGPPPCKCGKEAVEEEARLLKLHNVRLRQVASALASKLRASEATLGASRADADARLAALVRALLAFEAGLRREQSRIKFTMERLEALVRAQRAEITVLKAAGAEAGLCLEDTTSTRSSIAEADVFSASGGEVGSWGRGIRPASILRDVLRSQLGASWSKKEEGAKETLERSPALASLRSPGEGEEKSALEEEEEKMSVEVVAMVGGVSGAGGTRSPVGAVAGDGSRRPSEGGGGDRAADRVKPPLPPRPRPRLTTASSEEGNVSCREAHEKKSNRDVDVSMAGAVEEHGFRGHWAAVESGDKDAEGSGRPGSGMWGLNAHFEEFVLGEESSSSTVLPSGGHDDYSQEEDGNQPPSTPPPPPPTDSPSRETTTARPQTSPPPPPPTAKPRTALMKPPRKNPPPNKHQATTVSPPPMRFLLPDLLCPSPRGQERTGTLGRNGLETNGVAYLKENAMHVDRHATNSHGINGVAKGRPLGPSALQNAISPKGKYEAILEAAKGHCSYERFLEMTGLSQKSIITQHRPIPPPPASTSRPLPPPPPKHRSVLKPRDVKMRSKAARNVGWEDGFVAGDSVVGVVAKEAVVGPTRRYWSGPYL